MRKRKWKKPLNIALSAGLVASFVIPAVPITAEAATNAADLIISEYIVGVLGTNKAIELYNGTGKTVDLSEYSLELYSNGAATASQTLKLSGTLQNGQTYVIYNSTD